MIFHVTCSTDDNYVQHCMAMLCSFFENNKKYEICVHLLFNTLSEYSQKLISKLSERYENKVKYYKIGSEMIENFHLNDNILLNGKKMYSIATYFRYFLPSMLPDNIDKVLYLDCDIIVLKDVSELYNMNLSNYGVAAVKDSSPFDSYHRFKMGLGLHHEAFCAGMMMINLKFWRKNNIQQKLIEYSTANWKNVYMQDQDALNYVFRDSWFKLPYKWGKTPLSVAPVDYSQRWFDINEFVESPCIYHYSAHVKPWLDLWFPDQKYYWKYVKLSEFPNPQKTHANKKLKFKIYKSILRYLINKYIHPFVPNIIEITIKDILSILLFIINAFRPKHLKAQMLRLWCKKYGL